MNKSLTLTNCGMVFRNWNELSDHFNWKRTRGGQNSRKAQEKDLSCLCSWYRQGHKIIIDEIYDTPKERENNRFTFNDKYEQFNIPKEFEESMIIYEILLDKEVYIGSTVSPKKRFYDHMTNVNEDHKITCDMIKRGAVFNLVQVFEDEELMRMCEDELIKLYCSYDEFDCKNKLHNKNYMRKSNKKSVDLKINIKDLDSVVKLLSKNGIDYKIK